MTQAKTPTPEDERDALFYVLVDVASLVGEEVSIGECLASFRSGHPIRAIDALNKILSDLQLQKRQRLSESCTLKAEREKLWKRLENAQREVAELHGQRLIAMGGEVRS